MSEAPASRTALVTGGARGLGAAICRRLAEDGCDVAVLDLDAAACAETVAAVRAAGRRATALAADVSDEAQAADAVAQAAEALGAPTVLVNNAGVLRDRTLGKLTLEDWSLVLDVNLRGAFLMSRAALPGMRAAGWGRMVNLSSIAALGVHGEANYAAAKAGVQGLTRALAVELGRHGITVNAVAPGFVDTAMTRAVAERMGVGFADMEREMMRDIHVGRSGRPEDVANAVSFFADPRSSFVTGQVLYVAGGPRG